MIDESQKYMLAKFSCFTVVVSNIKIVGLNRPAANNNSPACLDHKLNKAVYDDRDKNDKCPGGRPSNTP
jgi:hypothetical protein